ncbi:hypothetical protein JYU34_010585 [Plutella xylostella]|uniref:Uncharacterized protein n=2 Tax=Plutella xylostella TaxID=51655 RepID=A0ABQ7QIU5_PLUXY|nr:hypothetical protein JYU34_010585 [Plutella xylostella]CAG9133065.1 unnamed protein product [Plutella xylostella]
MAVFDGEIDFRSVTMVDFDRKEISRTRARPRPTDDNCLIVGLQRDKLSLHDPPPGAPDTLCVEDVEYYKHALERLKEECPKLGAQYFSNDIDTKVVENEIQDLKRSEYFNKYCSRDLPFMSVNLARRARALQTLRLPDDVHIPETTYRGSYRPIDPGVYTQPPLELGVKPKYDPTLQNKLREILRVNTGESVYGASHALLGKVVLQENPFGKPREEPKYGVWKTPYTYTYWVN